MRFGPLTAIALTIAAAALPSGARALDPGTPVECRHIDEGAVKGFFKDWVDALPDKTTAKMMKLYGDNASLLPTVENGPYFGKAQIQPYFVTFLGKDPKVISEHEYIRIGCNIAYDIGLYTFGLNDHGIKKIVPARFTFIYAPDAAGVWHIVHHHSSEQPVKTPPRKK